MRKLFGCDECEQNRLNLSVTDGKTTQKQKRKNVRFMIMQQNDFWARFVLCICSRDSNYRQTKPSIDDTEATNSKSRSWCYPLILRMSSRAAVTIIFKVCSSCQLLSNSADACQVLSTLPLKAKKQRKPSKSCFCEWCRLLFLCPTELLVFLSIKNR